MSVMCFGAQNWTWCFTSAEQRATITPFDLLAPKSSEGHLFEPVLGVGSLLAVVVLLQGGNVPW